MANIRRGPQKGQIRGLRVSLREPHANTGTANDYNPKTRRISREQRRDGPRHTCRRRGRSRARKAPELGDHRRALIRAPNRAMMWAMGLTDKDINAPFVGVASTHNEVTPCNSGIAPLVEEVKRGVFAARGTPFTFGTITVSDAISMGTEGMKGSLVSREVIADSIETVCFAERFDGLVAVAGCDKSLPGAMMAMARLNLPSIFIYGGSILPGNWRGRDIQIQTVFEAVGQRQAGLIDDDELRAIEVHACPGPGACGGMFTANTMSSIGEALGLSLPGSASEPAVDQRKLASSRRAGEAVLNLLRKDIRPSDIPHEGKPSKTPWRSSCRWAALRTQHCTCPRSHTK